MAPGTRTKKIEDTVQDEVEMRNLQLMIDEILREVIREEAGEREPGTGVDTGAVVERLLDSSAVQQLVEKVTAMRNTPHRGTPQPSPVTMPRDITDKIVPGRRYLYLKLLGGRAFVDHLGSSGGAPQCSLVIHLGLHTHRFRTKPILCVCDPKIQEGFLFDLQQLKPGHTHTLDAADLLLLPAAVSLLVVKVRQPGTDAELISAQSLEWQSLLAQPSSGKFVCQLMGVGSEKQVPVGLLDIEATLIPPLESPVPHKILADHLHSVRTREGEKHRLFIAYTQNWWREYTEASDKHAQRMVKIFSVDEHGKNRFVCEMVRRLEVGQALRFPEEAARWVSVLPSATTTTSPPPPAGATAPWFTLHTAITAPTLNVESKCSLLCSLLLGFGLDAWVCVGTRQGGRPHLWVLTRGPYTAVTLWEATTGSHYLHRVGQRGAHDYCTVGSVFNHQSFHANCQASDSIEYCNFALEDASLWKKMSYKAVSSVVEKGVCRLPLSPASGDSDKYTATMESQLKALIAEHRKTLGFSSHFDEHLSYMLTPALWSYEREAVDGGNFTENRAVELFSAALMNVVPEGFTFKGFPIHFTHRSPRRTFMCILNSSVGREVVECRGDRVSLAVRAITVCYPEDVCVTWLMAACTFRQVG